MPNLAKAYQSQLIENKLDNLTINGDIPTWLSGCFISNGPAQFELGTDHFNHWFDGFAMLKKFNFNAGKVSFENRFLQSRQYRASREAGKLNTSEFGTYADASMLGRIKSAVKNLISGNTYDNCNINTMLLNEHFVAMTESNHAIEFKLSDLSTIGPFEYMDAMPGQLTTAHPQFDFYRGETINVSIDVGQFIHYHVYKIAANSTKLTSPHPPCGHLLPMSGEKGNKVAVLLKREIIQTVRNDKLFYMHSFSLTQNHVILFKCPLTINKYKLLLGLPFNHCLYWQENTPSSFIIIDRNNGSHFEVETDHSFVCLHSVNAFEYSQGITLDLVCHQPGNPYDNLLLSNLRSEKPSLPTGEIRRYEIDINTKTCKHKTLSALKHEFPRINYQAVNGNDYQFVYSNVATDSQSPFLNAIHKLNTQTGETQCFERLGYFPGEAVFVQKTGSQREDEGVLLSIAFNTSTQCSSLIILDAHTLQQIAEVALPFHLPFGLHGNYFSFLG